MSKTDQRPKNMTLAEFCEWARRERTRWFHGCELWTGSKTVGKTGGYGSARFKGRTRRVHTLIAEHYHGPAPDGCPYACHICHNRACINPAHLYWGTPRDNVRDCEAAGRRVHPKGEAHHGAVLTEAKVRMIRLMAAGGVGKVPLEGRVLAGMFGTTTRNIEHIIAGKSWAGVSP